MRLLSALLLADEELSLTDLAEHADLATRPRTAKWRDSSTQAFQLVGSAEGNSYSYQDGAWHKDG
ncbi:hypothetical protein NOCA2230133 [metagenome]|uniref:Uncharacterized protein n=1 Tax=metagenome TaxID=256318 RepID=A0A2P2BZL3_9ZZZZ